MRLVSILATFVAVSLLSGCFGPSVGGAPVVLLYDSRWGESKAAQKRNAAAAAPAALHSGTVPEGGGRSGALHVYRVRVYATQAYAAQTLDWKRKAQDLMADANAVLEPSLRTRLEIESLRDWAFSQEDDLPRTLASLRNQDGGAEVDWVVGMVGGLSRTTVSFHQLGLAELGGKYLVVRAPGELEEQKAIERNFTELKDEERSQLVRTRKRHRATAVFLHEVGHILGAPHVREPRSFMAPEYDAHMESYDEASMARMRVALERPAAVPPEPVVEKTWPADVAALPEDERATYGKAMRAYEDGNAAAAYEAGHALFESRRDVVSVQDLRCKVALGRGLAWTETSAECDALMKLSTSQKK